MRNVNPRARAEVIQIYHIGDVTVMILVLPGAGIFFGAAILADTEGPNASECQPFGITLAAQCGTGFKGRRVALTLATHK